MIAGFAGKDAYELIEDTAVLRLVGSGIEAVAVFVALGKVDFYRGVEIHLKLVVAGFEQAFHIYAPCAVHIVGVENGFAIEIHVGISVEPVEHKLLIAARCLGGCSHKRGFIHPVLLIDPLHTTLIEAEEGVFDYLIGNEVGVNRTRYCCRIPNL